MSHTKIPLPEGETVPAESNPNGDFTWDAFIAHASEDKQMFVQRLASMLRDQGVRVWYDEYALTVGDSLRRSIDEGLTQSRYGIVVLSPNFFAKEWPQRELDGLATRDLDTRKVILPVWLDVDLEEVRSFSPTLADRRAAKAADGLASVVEELLRVIQSTVPTAPVIETERDAIRHEFLQAARSLFDKQLEDLVE